MYKKYKIRSIYTTVKLMTMLTGHSLIEGYKMININNL